MTREQFMSFFRDDEKLNTLTPDDRAEIFSSILLGSSDITKDVLDQLICDYNVTNLEVLEYSECFYLMGSSAVYTYENYGISSVKDRIKEGNLDYGLHKGPSRLNVMSAFNVFDGWNKIAEITEQEYNFLKNT